MDRVRILWVSNKLYCVYHFYSNTKKCFNVALAELEDLTHLRWKFIRILDNQASMADIKTHKTWVFVIYEKTQASGNFLELQIYENLDCLIFNKNKMLVSINPNLGNPNEGTPTIHSIHKSKRELMLDLSFHFFDGTRDLNASGVLSINVLNRKYVWVNQRVNVELNNAIKKLKIDGNIGDRTLRSPNKILVEAQKTLNDWSSWSLFEYNILKQTAKKVKVLTHNNASSIGNPTYYRIKYRQKTYLFFSCFVFSEAALSQESGQLMAVYELK